MYPPYRDFYNSNGLPPQDQQQHPQQQATPGLQGSPLHNMQSSGPGSSQQGLWAAPNPQVYMPQSVPAPMPQRSPPLPPQQLQQQQPMQPSYSQAWSLGGGGGAISRGISPALQPSPPPPQQSIGRFMSPSPQPGGDPFPTFIPKSYQMQQGVSQLGTSTPSPRLPPSSVAAPMFEPRRSQSHPGLSSAPGMQQADQGPSALRSAVNAPQFVPRSMSSGGPGDSSQAQAPSKVQITPPLQPQPHPSSRFPPQQSPRQEAIAIAPSPSPRLQPQQSQDPDSPARPGFLKSTAAPFQPGRSTMKAPSPGPGESAPGRLTVQAQPFVPGGGDKLGANGLRSSATPFQPGGIGQEGDMGEGVQVEGQEVDYVDEEGYEEEEHEADFIGDEVFDWSMGASSVGAPRRKSVGQLGVPEQLRQFLLMKDLDKLRAMAPDDERYKELPPRYHLAYPLDDESKPRGATGAFGYSSVVYKVMDQEDGNVYALRRFDGVRTAPKIVTSAVDSWRRIQHPNIVPLHKAFAQHNGALFFVHEYCPEAQNIMQRYILPRGGPRLRETHIWSILVQLVSAIRAVHSSNAACRMVHPNYVLVTTGNRVRLNCAGVADVLEAETRKTVAELQKTDILFLGRLLVMLATRSVITPQNFSGLLGVISQAYSPELHSLAVQLCTKPPTVFDLTNMLSRHIMDEVDRQYKVVDDLEEFLSAEYESGRLFRLSLKVSHVVERPQHALDPQWAETGSRYILKLFRDYVFHQVDEEGKPVIDLGHVVHSLNKLDVGDPEKILLMGRDQQTMIIVSFEEVKRCLEEAWIELCASGNFNPHVPEFGAHAHHSHGGHRHQPHMQLQHAHSHHGMHYQQQQQQVSAPRMQRFSSA